MIRVQALSKNFNNFQAVDQVSFEVQRGEVLGFLGPNGAGKSTTMKMLTCFIPPSSGTADICGNNGTNTL
jgi:ABC-2 type transport system ATP-binding protein